LTDVDYLDRVILDLPDVDTLARTCRRRRRRQMVAVIVCVLMGVSGFALVLGARSGALPQLVSSVRDAPIQTLLDRRANAVNDRNKVAFLADVNPADQALIAQQSLEFDNLTKLPLVYFSYQVEARTYDDLAPMQLRQRYGSALRAPGVTIRYQIEGIDAAPTAAPWVPVLATIAGEWRFVGRADGDSLPIGTNGQPWDASTPITVSRGDRLVLVLSADDAARASQFQTLAEQARGKVATVCPTPPSVLIVGVRNSLAFRTRFHDHAVEERTGAFAEKRFGEVLAWHRDQTRLVGNTVYVKPWVFDADPMDVSTLLRHELTHVAMSPYGNPATPRWLVEGLAEYVAYRDQPWTIEHFDDLDDLDEAPKLPEDRSFYDDAAGLNYFLGWFACWLIATDYGEDRLIGLYRAFSETTNQNVAFNRVLGIGYHEFQQRFQSRLDGI
jgi:hypothetical protein